MKLYHATMNRFLVIAAVALALAGPRLMAQAVALRPGDTLDIRIANVPAEDVAQFTGIYTIDESGMVNLPYAGPIKAGGLPASQVQVAIQNKLIADQIYTNPTVIVNPPVGRSISVSGSVRAPGRIQYSSDLTLLSAISAAGGLGDFGGDLVRLTRGGKVQKYSIKKLKKDPSQDPLIQPGDQIEVVEGLF
jgi:polysaccharide export outer membrane protein